MKSSNKIIITILLLLLLVGCNKTSNDVEKNIKIGCMRITEEIIDIIIPEMESKGFKVEKVVFDGASNIAATALNDESIDGFIVNHLQWVEVFNEKNKTNLQLVKPYIYYFKNGVYSSKYDSIDKLPNGAIVAIPGDTNNMDRSLRLLEKMNLIKIDKNKELCNISDIIENPKNIELIETEITATVKSLYDVDMIISGANAMRLAGEDFTKSLFDDPIDKEYPISLTVREDSLEEDWVKELMNVTKKEAFIKKFNDHYKGTFILY